MCTCIITNVSLICLNVGREVVGGVWRERTHRKIKVKKKAQQKDFEVSMLYDIVYTLVLGVLVFIHNFTYHYNTLAGILSKRMHCYQFLSEQQEISLAIH